MRTIAGPNSGMYFPFARWAVPTSPTSREFTGARVVQRVMGESALAKGTTSITRRRFVADGAVLALLLTSLRNLRATAVPPVLVRSTFVPLVGTTFRMIGGGRDDDVVLAEVDDIAPVRWPDDQVCFALYFDAPEWVPGTDGIYSFGHHRIGNVDLFVTAMGRAGDANTFAAVIDRRL
jgi:hypothetical protein